MIKSQFGNKSNHDQPAWWAAVVGFLLYVFLMSAGYYYNLTFVQLGLVDLGIHQIGLPRSQVVWLLTLLAVLTCLISLVFGWQMTRWNWSKNLFGKLRAAFGVVVLQTMLTYTAAGLETAAGFQIWIVVCSAALGIGVPVTFSLAVDTVPRRWRGAAGAWITGLSYLAANLLPSSWTLESFSRPLLVMMPLGVIGLGLLAFVPFPGKTALENLGSSPRYSQGRYAPEADQRLFVFILLMFGVFFVDSLGFLRLLETPLFMENTWQADDPRVRLLIGGVHFLAAMIGGVLYRALDIRELFFWIFGIFALAHLLSSFQVRLESTTVPLAMTIVYAVTVSLYTVITFSLWADLSTQKSISMNAALGVSLSGWTATFLSTSISIWMNSMGVSLLRHLNITNAIAMMFLVVMILITYFSSPSRELP